MEKRKEEEMEERKRIGKEKEGDLQGRRKAW